jgi:hypothetical protein
MGHAAHFLTRIERLSARQADVALALYRDSELVRYILERVVLPEHADRVAVALEHANSPHVIVTRTGAFVTCLAAGMTTDATPVISRAQLDHLDEKFDFVREGFRRAERVQESRQLMHRMLSGGSALSREDFTALRSLMPLLGAAMFKLALETGRSLTKMLDVFRSKKYRRRGDEATEALQGHWSSFWTLGHTIALCGSYIDDLPETQAEMRADYTRVLAPLLRMALCTMIPHVAVRAIWVASRVGRPLVPDCRDRIEEARSFSALLYGLAPLVAVALREPGLRAEAHEVIERALRRVEGALDPELRGLEHGAFKWVLEYCHRMLGGDFDDVYIGALRQSCAPLVALRSARLPEGHPQRWDKPEDVPDELSFSAVAYVEHSMLVAGSPRQLTFLALPWIARASADDLYVPDQYLEVHGNTFRPELTLQALELYERYYGVGRPVRTGARPGRNELCTCGSGKKYKRCCGAAA